MYIYSNSVVNINNRRDFRLCCLHMCAIYNNLVRAS